MTWNPKNKTAGPKQFANNSRDAGDFDSDDDAEKETIRQAITDRITNGRSITTVQDPVSDPTGDTWPNAFADTSHVDETEISASEYETIATKLNGQNVLARLNRIVGPQAPGMRRLARIFEWTLYRTSVLMGDLNSALTKRTSYNTVRQNYVNFLRDLDDHEPEKGPKKSPRDQKLPGRPQKLDPLKKENASGYGRSIKWTCIEPVIFGGKIVGTRVVVKWNPHISSSGIPIKHD